MCYHLSPHSLWLNRYPDQLCFLDTFLITTHASKVEPLTKLLVIFTRTSTLENEQHTLENEQHLRTSGSHGGVTSC